MVTGSRQQQLLLWTWQAVQLAPSENWRLHLYCRATKVQCSKVLQFVPDWFLHPSATQYRSRLNVNTFPADWCQHIFEVLETNSFLHNKQYSCRWHCMTFHLLSLTFSTIKLQLNGPKQLNGNQPNSCQSPQPCLQKKPLAHTPRTIAQYPALTAGLEPLVWLRNSCRHANALLLAVVPVTSNVRTWTLI